MSTGVALHVGLNELNPKSYDGWDGRLDAGENDAVAMAELTEALGYRSTVLLSRQATAEAVLGRLREAASDVSPDGIVVLTYAGHGGQFEDLDSDEEDSRDETWLLYDREVLDDEIRVALGTVPAGVRVVVLSDSCHSGTVIRGFYDQSYDQVPEVRAAYTRVAPRLRSRRRGGRTASRAPRWRGAPPSVQRRVLQKERDRYTDLRRRTPRDAEVKASVILLSGCQDNQESLELDGHGLFTAAVLHHWNGGEFEGSYRSLHRAVCDDMPPSQSPGFLSLGSSWPDFENQLPFEIASPHGTAPAAASGAVPVNAGAAACRLELDIRETLGVRDPLGRLVIEYHHG